LVKVNNNHYFDIINSRIFMELWKVNIRISIFEVKLIIKDGKIKIVIDFSKKNTYNTNIR